MFYKTNIEKKTLKNNNYRKVLYTTSNLQLVLMSLKPGEEIGIEKHKGTTQFIRVEAGNGLAIIDGERKYIKDGDVLVINPNTYHNIINIGNEKLKLYTIYTPPEHSRNLVEKNKI
jgi:mannose-6-phosphate isomerase-like protein (cupin superfamily)